MKTTINILGSTGSIGSTSLKIIDKKKNLFKINTLTANSNYKKIYYQIKKFKPKNFVVMNKIVFDKLIKQKK